jgi:hypothetical protein
MISYRQITDCLFSPQIEKYIPDGMAHSLAVIGKERDVLLDCFFIYSIDYTDKTYALPSIRLGINTENGVLGFCKTTQEMPFKSSAGKTSLRITLSIDFEKYVEYERSYQSLYPAVRDFAYKNGLTAEQKKTLAEYYRVLGLITDDTLKPFYRELSTSFFDWMGISM